MKVQVSGPPSSSHPVFSTREEETPAPEFDAFGESQTPQPVAAAAPAPTANQGWNAFSDNGFESSQPAAPATDAFFSETTTTTTTVAASGSGGEDFFGSPNPAAQMPTQSQPQEWDAFGGPAPASNATAGASEAKTTSDGWGAFGGSGASAANANGTTDSTGWNAFDAGAAPAAQEEEKKEQEKPRLELDASLFSEPAQPAQPTQPTQPQYPPGKPSSAILFFFLLSFSPLPLVFRIAPRDM